MKRAPMFKMIYVLMGLLRIFHNLYSKRPQWTVFLPCQPVNQAQEVQNYVQLMGHPEELKTVRKLFDIEKA